MVGKGPRKALSEAELDAMKVLWKAGPQSAGEVRAVLNGQGRAWAYTTTKTILDRLEEKGYVRRKRTATPHVYVPMVSAEAVALERVGKIRRDMFSGAGLPMIRALVEDTRLTPEEIAALRALLDQLAAGHERNT